MKKGYTYIIVSAIIFSTMEIGGKIIAGQINPFQLTFLRFLIGGLFLLPFAIKELSKRNLILDKNDFKFFIWTGFLCVIVSMTFFQLAIVYTKASTVAILFSTNPIFTIPFAYFILKENLVKRTVISLMLSIIGIIFILNPLNIGKDIFGIVLAILAAITFSVYTVMGKKKAHRYGSIILNSFTFISGALLLLIYIMISNTSNFINIANEYRLFKAFVAIPIFTNITFKNLIVIMYLGIVVTGLGYLFFFMAMEKTSAAKASIVFFIKPALAPILSFIVLKETVPTNALLGIMFILLGSYIGLNKKS